MSFFIYDIIFLAIFTSFVAWFLYTRRKKLDKEGILFLYRTSFGIKAIDWFSEKFKKPLRYIQYISIATGYVLMATMLYLFFQLVYIYVKNPEIVRAIKIPPIMPLIPYLPSIFKLDFLPPFYFTYWILILAVVAIVHEFAHGIFARLHKIKVKSTGFGFLGPFLAAFVEPDEKEMTKRPIRQQLSILTAGTFANILTCLLFLIIFVLFFVTMYSPAGAVFNTYTYSAINISAITSVNNILVNNPSVEQISSHLDLTNEKNLTKIKIDENGYLLENNQFLKTTGEIQEIILVYDDLPAINAELKGAIIKFNNEKVTSTEDLKNEILKYSPGDVVKIKTNYNHEILEYEIKLAGKENGKPYLGIGLLQPSTEGIRGKIYLALSLIKEPGTYYERSFNTDLIEFIYDLLWWMILINVSIALVNMLPLGIFDGGRVFYLTILSFTKSEKIAMKFFKYMTMFLLGLLGLIMFFWLFSFLSF